MQDFIGTAIDEAAVKGEHQGSGIGVLGTSATGPGVFGHATTNHGVHGESDSGRGVVGVSGNFVGVSGTCKSGATGIGVAGDSALGIGVAGRSAGGGPGVQGDSASGFGVLGNATTNHGVHGESITGRGVVGISGNFVGVSGTCKSGAEGIGVAGDSAAGIGVFGTGGTLAGLFKGDVKVTGKIDCFDVNISNADCAEEFELAGTEAVEPGTLMSFGTDGTLWPSSVAYDNKVVGVISGAGEYKPGIVLDKKQDGNRVPIALLGKVYCKVDADYSAIKVGDLLTTSPTAGHAMKATDPLKAFGSVIGKALRPKSEGRGMIPVLVTLQ